MVGAVAVAALALTACGSGATKATTMPRQTGGGAGSAASDATGTKAPSSTAVSASFASGSTGVPASSTVVGGATASTAPGGGGLATPAPPTTFHSQQLPVTVTPSTGLVDGQTVQVSGSGFHPNEQLAAVQCTGNALTAGERACRIGGNEVYFKAGADGSAHTSFKVARLLSAGGSSPTDCATAATPCVIGVAAMSDYSRSGGAQITFKPGLPPIARPVVEVSPASGLHDKSVVTVHMSGLTAGTSLTVRECGGAADAQMCTNLATVWAAPSATYSLQVPVAATIGQAPTGGEIVCSTDGPCGPFGHPVDCRAEAGSHPCTIVVQQGRDRPASDPAPIRFS